MRTLLVTAALMLLCSSCGYRLGPPQGGLKYRTISVPYAIGDHDGGFTALMVYALTSNGYRYQKCGADVQLKIELIEFRDENIGFRYDREKDGDLTRALIPAETRVSVVALVILTDCDTGCQIVPPFQVTASIEFDHDYYTTRDGVNVTSLGQLTDIDAAKDAAYHPLNQRLAQRIVDYLNQLF